MESWPWALSATSACDHSGRGNRHPDGGWIRSKGTTLGAELARLESLQKVNPSIRDEEIEHLRYRIEECAIHIHHANLQMQALRLIITT